MINKFQSNSLSNQQGTVLIVALVFLAIIAIISASVMRTGVLEIKMVGNAQFKEEAFQISEGVLDAIVATYDTNLPVTGDVGYTVCSTNYSGGDCDSAIMSLPTAATQVSSGVDLTYKAERLGPLFAPPPFRMGEEYASSAAAFNVAIFETNVNYDGRDVRLGHHEVYQGIAIKVASDGQ